MKRAVITYIFGKGQELLREPAAIDKDTEYICVTDQMKLKSKIWRMIYVSLDGVSSLRDKTALTKFNPFLYTNADRIIIQDMSLKCVASLGPLFDEIEKNDICLKKHPERKHLAAELPHWRSRGITNSQIAKFYKMAKQDNIDLSSVPLYECCVMGIKNDKQTREMFSSLIALMKLLGENGNMIVTQQCPFAYMLKRFYPQLKIGYINQHDFFIRHFHNSNKVHKI